jgi:hypothetical protein
MVRLSGWTPSLTPSWHRSAPWPANRTFESRSTHAAVLMAMQPKKPASYDLQAADLRRNIVIQVGLTALVVIAAVALCSAS